MAMHLLCVYAMESLPQHIRIVVVVITQHIIRATICPTQDRLGHEPIGLEPQFTWRQGATDTRSGPRTCVAYQSLAPARDLCGIPSHELNYISFSCVLSGPWLFRGGWAICPMRVRDQVVLDATQVHHVGKVYKLCRDKIYPDSCACSLRHAMVESQLLGFFLRVWCVCVFSWKRFPNSGTEMSGKVVWKCQRVAVCF